MSVAPSARALIHDQRVSAERKATAHAAAEVTLGVSLVAVEEDLHRRALLAFVVSSAQRQAVKGGHLNVLVRHGADLLHPADHSLAEGLVDLSRGDIVFIWTERLPLGRIEHAEKADQSGEEQDQREFALLSLLVQKKGEPVSRAEILSSVFEDSGEATNVVDVYVNYLRRKIDSRFGVRLISTVRGYGYTIRS